MHDPHEAQNYRFHIFNKIVVDKFAGAEQGLFGMIPIELTDRFFSLGDDAYRPAFTCYITVKFIRYFC